MLCPSNLKSSVGIYAIICHGNGQIYIGSTSVGFGVRLNRHRFDLINGNHAAKYMGRSFIKYGIECFEFRVLEVVTKEECIDNRYILDLEQQWLDSFQPKFNSCQVAGNSTGFKHSQESIMRMSLAKIGKVISETTREKMSLAAMGNKNNPLMFWYTFTHEDGREIICDSAREFAREHGLDSGTIIKVINGRRKHHKGWSAVKNLKQK